MREEQVIVKNNIYESSNMVELLNDDCNKPQTHGLCSAEDKEDMPSTERTLQVDEEVNHSSCKTFTINELSKSTNKKFLGDNNPSFVIKEASMIVDKFILPISGPSTADGKSSTNGTAAIDVQNKAFIREILPIDNEVKLSVSEILHITYRNRLSIIEPSLPNYRRTPSELKISSVDDVTASKSSVNLFEEPSIEINEQKTAGANQILPKSGRDQIQIWIKTMAIFTFVFGAVSSR